MQSLASRASDPARAAYRARTPHDSPLRAAVPRGKPAMRGRRGAAALSDPPGAPSRSQSARFTFTDDDLAHVLCAAELSHGSDGLVQPHPRSGCVLLDSAGAVVARTFQMGQGGVRSEVLAVREAGAGVRQEVHAGGEGAQHRGRVGHGGGAQGVIGFNEIKDTRARTL